MRILLHDYGRFPYPWQLARSLARRGHTVNYVYSAADPARTTLDIAEEEEQRLSATPVVVKKPLIKDSFLKRHAWETEYGRTVTPIIDAFQPHVVIAANTPLDVEIAIQRCTKKHGAKFIFWVQDLVSIATYLILKQKMSVVGAMIGKYYMRLEQHMLQQSDEVVLITEDFRPFMDKWCVDRARTHVIENWAPIEQLPVMPRHNPWSEQHDLNDKFCILYAGTLGLKHNPDLIIRLAESMRKAPHVRIIVAGEGSGIPWLKQMQEEKQLDNLKIIPFQPFNVLPQALGAADMLVALLEPEGSKYCVPSKVLTYLCSARPLLLAVTPDNLSAQIVERNNAGIVVSPDDPEAFVQAADKLVQDSDFRLQCGRNARHYAETSFKIEEITDRFEMLICPPHHGVVTVTSREASVRN